MSILRDIARAGRHPPRAQPCPTCSHRIYKFEFYCPWCGGQNPRFDQGVFQTIAKVDLATAQRACTNQEPHHIEAVAYLLDSGLRALAGRSAFCSVCGTAFLVETWHT